ncbi:hypothetical protein POTOM_042569 [Populus tomentosa]|uniref:Short-chain dehydrogenase TIC 32, chloroplastic n=1 Tax=Populus tomentosa TaxID=118781 RepID=A0A8X7YKJ0_POPTO|nr:hypothetical protein POTOM_042569 [Populus tomentosa]
MLACSMAIAFLGSTAVRTIQEMLLAAAAVLSLHALLFMWFFNRNGSSGFSSSSTAEEVTRGVDASGLTAIVTGASSGIGTETARVLALRGVHVIMGVRNMASGREVKDALVREIPAAKVDVMELDLSSLASVRKFASEFNSSGRPLNLLMNYGDTIHALQRQHRATVCNKSPGYSFCHFLLTNLLLDTMKKTARESDIEGRIVNVSSEFHRYSYPERIRFDNINDQSGYKRFLAYGQSKLANVLHANELTRRFKEDGVNITANSLHPGVIATNLFRHNTSLATDNPIRVFLKSLAGLVLKNVQQGAATTCYVALNPQVKGVSGEYFSGCNLAAACSESRDAQLAKKLWDFKGYGVIPFAIWSLVSVLYYFIVTMKSQKMAWQQHGHGLSLLHCSTSQERTLLAAAAILSLHTLTTRLILDHLIMWFFKRKGSSGLSSSSTAEKVAQGIDASGLTAIVTGHTCMCLFYLNYDCFVLSWYKMGDLCSLFRVPFYVGVDRLYDAIVKEISTAKVDPMELDLSSLASVRKFASDFSSSGRPLNLLMSYGDTVHALQRQHRATVRNKSPGKRHVKDREGRIVNVSSESHCSPYPEGIRYDKIIDQPGATTCYVALNPQVKGVSGEYFSGCNPAAASSESRDAELAKKLWDFKCCFLTKKRKGMKNSGNVVCMIAFQKRESAMFCWTGLRPLAPEEIKWTNAYCSLPFEKGTSGFSASSTAEDVTQGIDGSGLTAIVTGASSGIGAETARVLALRGVHVVMGVRNLEAGRAVKEAIVKGNPNAKLDAMDLDLSSMASVKKFAEDFKSLNLPLNLLIYTFVSNNAGIMATPFMLSRDNIELQFATNHVGHFLLTNLLMETIRKTARASRKEGRIVNVSSRRHKFSYPEGIRFAKLNDPSGYNSLSAYGQSKLANILHANELARQLKCTLSLCYKLGFSLSRPSLALVPEVFGHCAFLSKLLQHFDDILFNQEDRVEVTANSVHPGLIATNLFRHYSFLTGLVGLVGKYVIKNVQQGAATTCYVALHPKVKGMSGQYFADSSIAKASLQANDAELATKLWDFSLDLVRRGSTPS